MMLYTTLLLSLSALATAQSLRPILPANPTQCSTISVSWSATGDPSQFYTARIVNAQDSGGPDADHAYAFLTHGNGTLTAEWRVGLPVGTEIALAVTDDNGNREYSAPTIVQRGDDSCMPVGVTRESNADARANGPGGSGGSFARNTSGANAAIHMLSVVAIVGLAGLASIPLLS